MAALAERPSKLAGHRVMRGCFGLLLAVAMVLSPAAKADNWYFQGLVGKRFLTDADLTLGGTTSDMTIAVDAVPSGSAAVGYRFPAFPHRALDMRVEIQGGAAESEPDTITPRGALASRVGTTSKQGADAENLHSIYAMTNLWFDYSLGHGWVVSAGGGIGASYINWEDFGCCNMGAFLNDSDIVFAYQAGAAIGYEIIKDLVIGLDYRYFATADAEFNDNGNWSATYGAHDLMFAFRYYAF